MESSRALDEPSAECAGPGPSPSDPPRTTTGIPGRARLFVLAIIVLGGMALVGATLFSLRTLPTRFGVLVLLGALAVTASVPLWQLRLTWNGQRIAVHPGEAAAFVAFFFAPPLWVVPAVALGALLGRIALGGPRLGAAFHVAVETVAATLAAAAISLLVGAGATLFIADLATPLVMSVASRSLIACLVTQPAPQGSTGKVRALAVGILVSTAAGTVLGVAAVALHPFLPAIVYLVIPLAWIVVHVVDAGYRHGREVAARRAFATAGERMLEAPTEDGVSRAVLDALREALSPLAAGIATGAEGAREWRIGASRPPSDARTLRCSVPGTADAGASIWVCVDHARESSYARDREILEVAASTLGLGWANARSRVRVERAEGRLRELLDALPDPILVLSERDAITFANSAARALAPLRGLSARSLRDVFVVTHGRGGALELRLEDDDERVWEGRISPLGLEDGSPARILLATEVTQRRRLERDLSVHQEALSRSERLSALGTLVAGVAHEVNNPLAYMAAGLDLASLDLEDACEELAESGVVLHRVDLALTRRRIENVQSGAERIADITKALKVVAKPSDHASRAPVSIAELALELELLLRPLVPDGVHLRIEVEGKPLVMGSASDLQRAFLNLAKNALEALGPGPGHVTITIAQDDGVCVVRVADDGPGMPGYVKSRAFTPFFTTKPDGTGLGLPTVHGTVTAHGGSIALESAPHRGTVFTIKLPTTTVAAPSTGSDAHPARAPGRHGVP